MYKSHWYPIEINTGTEHGTRSTNITAPIVFVSTLEYHIFVYLRIDRSIDFTEKHTAGERIVTTRFVGMPGTCGVRDDYNGRSPSRMSRHDTHPTRRGDDRSRVSNVRRVTTGRGCVFEQFGRVLRVDERGFPDEIMVENENGGRGKKIKSKQNKKN